VLNPRIPSLKGLPRIKRKSLGLIKQTDILRGDVARSTYIRRAVEYYLKQVKTRVTIIVLGITTCCTFSHLWCEHWQL